MGNASNSANRSSISPSLKNCGYFDILPDEVIKNILKKLSPSDLGRIARVNRKFRRLAYKADVWMILCNRDFPGLLNKIDSTDFRNIYRTTYLQFMNRNQKVIKSSNESNCCYGGSTQSSSPNQLNVTTDQASKIMKSRTFKICLLGNSGVGKSCLVSTYISERFNNHLEATVGAAFFSKKHILASGDFVKLEIWDTAGQERYRSLSPMYYRGAHAIIVVFDVTNYQSFDGAKYWVRELQSSTENILLLVLVGNKADLPNHQVPRSEIDSYCQSTNSMYLEVSAKTQENIHNLFEIVSQQLLKSVQQAYHM